MTSFGSKKFLTYIILICIFFLNNAQTIENKIVLKIDNKIITSLDIDNEIRYLKVLNPNIKSLNEKESYKIGKNSLIREKIKQYEISKYVSDLKIEKKYLNQIIRTRYSKLNIKSKEEFLNYLKNYNIDISIIEKKITIEALWNQLIYSKFSNRIKIDKDEIREKVKNDNNQKLKSYLLSEIIFDLINDESLEDKYLIIKKSILDNGFENTALQYSISNTSDIGGKLGWINNNSLNKSIKDNLSKLKVKETTKPIFTSTGYLILKIEDIKFTKKDYDIEKQIKNLSNFQKNQQLNQYSNNYFNKIKKNFKINEL